MATEFATYLTALVAERNARVAIPHDRWSPARLALALDIDPSLVRRWLRGDRVPALGSNYLTQLADLLELRPGQLKALEQAQLASLRGRANGGVASGSATTAPRRQPARARRSTHSWSLPAATAGESRLLGTPEALLAYADQMVQQLPRVRPHAATILIAEQGEEILDLTDELTGRWADLFKSIVQRGWDVECLVRLPTQPVQLLPLVRIILALANIAGSFRIRYVTEPGPLPVPYSLVVVPERFALIGLATRQDQTVDSLLQVVDPAGIRACRDHFFQLRRRTTPLFTTYSEDQRLAFEEELTAASRSDAPRTYVVKDGFSNVTIPPHWAREDATWVRSRATGGLDARIIAAVLQQRLELADQYITHHPYLTICPISGVERWLTEGLDARDVQPQAGLPVSSEERVERLRTVLAILERRPSFQLALWDVADGALPAATWRILAEHSVFVTGWRDLARGRWEPVHLKMTHPAMMAAFGLDFQRLWQQVPPSRRSKPEVLEWLRARLAEYLASQRAHR